MGRVLSIDLAFERKDIGTCIVEERKGRVVGVRFLSATKLKILDRPKPKQFAAAIHTYCQGHGIPIVFLDGPQGWKNPTSNLEYRCCERILNTPGKTGLKGQGKPRSWPAFARFSISLFTELVRLGANLAHKKTLDVHREGLLALESFPTAAWKKLFVLPLPGKKKLSPSDLEGRLHVLQRLFGFSVERLPNHDELQALIAGLAGVAVLAGDTNGYIVEGDPPMEAGEVTVEGFIVNPRLDQKPASGFCSLPTAFCLLHPCWNRMATTKTTKSAKKPIAPETETLERMLYYLKLARASEERIERVLYRQGKIVGGVYVGRGQEAVGVATAIQLVAGDVIIPCHRDFAAFVIRGFTLREIFCTWMARANTTTRGRDNTLHLGDMKRGVIPIISHLGDTCPVACGVAMVLKRRGKGNVAVVHFGEGTTSRGDVHEAMNLASVMKLPVIFVCNNNGYAYSTPVEKQYAVKDLSVRGAAYNMPGLTVDGNDVQAVYAAAAKAIARARAGHGPSFIECKTFRMTGHSAHDMAEYVPDKLFAQWEKKDPIARLEKHLLAKRLLDRERIREMEEAIRKEIDDAVVFADASPFPEGSSALEGVYCESNCWWERELSR